MPYGVGYCHICSKCAGKGINMDYLELLKSNKPYASCYLDMPNEYQIVSKKLCFEYNHTAPDEIEKRREILSKLLGTSNDNAIIEPSFRCDYGFNIHLHGFALINYNCVFLDTSPIHLGDNVYIAPGVCLACAGHAILPQQRSAAIGTSAPITIEDDVWIGANVTIIGGIIIGKGSVIGAGSVVTRNIPSGVIACGNPCRVIREISEKDRINSII